MVERTSAESSTPDRLHGPSLIAANRTARCDTDLSPGTRTVPWSEQVAALAVTRPGTYAYGYLQELIKDLRNVEVVNE